MVRRIASGLLAMAVVVLLAAACSSSTVIGEGRLSEPAAVDPVEETASTDRGDRAPAESAAADAADGDDDSAPSDAAEDDDTVSLGDEALIEAWSGLCADGSDLACDVLFTITERGSEAEDLALTCGGRSDVDVRFCTPDIEAFEDRLWFDEDSPGLPDVVEDCESGDLISCDFLYFRSEVGSTYEEIGNSCGGQVAVAIPDCRSALAE